MATYFVASNIKLIDMLSVDVSRKLADIFYIL